jgi:hypothetical protein
MMLEKQPENFPVPRCGGQDNNVIQEKTLPEPVNKKCQLI